VLEEKAVGDDLMQEALEALSLVPETGGPVTPEEFEKYRLFALAEVDGLCGGEEAIAAANFRRVGPGGKALAPDVGDRLALYGLGGLARKGRGLLGGRGGAWTPKLLLLAVTPKRLYAFDPGYRYSMRRHRRKTGRPIEVAAWDRDGARIEVAKPRPMTTLRIEPLDGGAVVHLAGPSTADDPWSLAVMALLDPSPTSAPAGGPASGS
jgi:hypothetical protein